MINKNQRLMQIGILTLGKMHLESELNKEGKMLVDIQQHIYRGRRASDVRVEGYSPGKQRIIIRDYRIMSVNPDVIARIVINNWY